MRDIPKHKLGTYEYKLLNRVPVPSSGHFFKRVTLVHLNVLLSPPFQFILMLNLFV